MCGRFVQHQSPRAYAEQFGVDPQAAPMPNAPPRFNAAPTNDLLVVRRHPEIGTRHLSLLRWGLVPSFASDPSAGARLINARSETIAQKASFAPAWRARRRCIVPADAFYEWPEGGKVRQPFLISRRDGRALALAGLWEGWKDPASGAWLRTFAILTCAAAPGLARVHPRMPVILPEEAIAPYLEADDPRPLLRPLDDAALALWPVSAAVNSVRNDGAALMEPLDAGAAEAAWRLLGPGLA